MMSIRVTKLKISGEIVEVAALRLALEMADESAKEAIDNNCLTVLSKSGARLWHQLDPDDEYSWFYVERAIRYLTLRGKLKRKKGAPDLVKVRR